MDRALLERAAVTKGVICPTCDQKINMPRRRLSRPAAASLMVMGRITRPGQYVHVNRDVITPMLRGDVPLPFPFDSASGDYARSGLWGLIEHQYHPSGRKVQGMWMITKKGRDFVNGEIRIREHAVTYNNKCLRLEGNAIKIQDCFPNGMHARILEGWVEWDDKRGSEGRAIGSLMRREGSLEGSDGANWDSLHDS